MVRRLIVRPMFAAAVIALTVFIWIASPSITGRAERNVEGGQAAQAVVEARPKVRIRDSQAVPHSLLVEIRGRTEAERSVIVRAETGGVVVATPVEKGGAVTRGDILCRIDLKTRTSQRRQAEAALAQQELELEAAEKLAAQGHRSQLALAATRAAYEAVASQLESIREDIADTSITAPFEGILEDVHVEEGDLLSPGQPCATVIDLSPILVTAEATEKEVQHITLDSRAIVRVEGQEETEGRVKYVAASAHPQTRTFRIEVEVPNRDGNIPREGMTAKLTIPSTPVLAHELPAAVLTLNDKGQIGVRVVEDDIVHFKAGEIVGSAPGKIWLAGPDSFIRLIIVGQEFVSEGVLVEALYETTANANPESTPSPLRP